MSTGCFRTGLVCLVLLFASCGDDVGVNNRDTTPPAAITDLEVTVVTEQSIALAWTAPGDNGGIGIAQEYELRLKEGEDFDWGSATVVPDAPLPDSAGKRESMVVSGLASDSPYSFAVKAFDEQDNWSELSNVVVATTLISTDSVPPSTISDLRVIDSDTSQLTLSWTAPGDDGDSGIAHQYDVRYAVGSSLIWEIGTPVAGIPLPHSAGISETLIVPGLEKGTSYAFGIKTVDENNNWSEISNVVLGKTNALIWQISVGGAGEDVANSVVVCSDGGIVIAGKTNSTSAGDYDGYVVKIDSDGDVVWERTFGGPAEDVVNDIIATSDGGFAGVGFTKSSGAGGNDGWLVKLNSSGTKVWEKTFGHTGEDVLNALVRTPDGGFAMVGTWNGNDSLHYGAWVTKTSSSGLLEWQRSYKDAGEDCDDSRDISAGGGICLSHDGALVFSWHGEGDVYYPWPDDICLPIFVATVLSKISFSGVLVWSHIYTYMTYAESDCVVQTGDNGYASLSSVYGSGQSLAKANVNGELLWKVSSFADGGVAHGLAGLNGGGIVLVGHTNYQTSGGLDAWISTIDPLGNTVDSLTVGGDAEDRFHAVTELPDGSIIAVGYTDSFSESRDVYIVKIAP